MEISANCDNPNFFFCSNVVGLGGVWAWAELNQVPSTTDPGWNEIDGTIAECGHTRGGGGGPGSAGAGGGPDPVGAWQKYASLGAALTANPTAEPLLNLSGQNQYTGAVYVLDFFPGSGAQDFMPIVPVAQGHYSAQPAPGVSLQIQVAP